jgi:hypothetical protein
LAGLSERAAADRRPIGGSVEPWVTPEFRERSGNSIPTPVASRAVADANKGGELLTNRQD